MSTLKTASLQHPDASANTINLSSAGNVGIGETTPDNTLHVNSGTTNIAAKFESTDATAGILLLDNTGNVELTTTGGNFEVRPAGGSPVVTVNSSGNVGIGTTPSAWRPEYSDKALDIGTHSAIYDQTGTGTWITNNVYRATSNPLKYKITAGAGYLAMDGGTLSFSNAPSGTAGTTATFTERMAVDTSGRVTMPYQPSFEAYRTLGNVAQGNIVVFNNTRHNTGNHFNTSTGVFTAPVAGAYIFTHQCFTDSGNGCTVDMQINGVNRLRMEADINSAYRSLAASAVFDLSANDTVRIYTTSGTAHYNTSGFYSSFTGHLLG